MKSKERHNLQHNKLLDILKNLRGLTRKYGLTVLIVVVTAAVAIFLIDRVSDAEERKWQQAWLPLETAADTNDEEQLRTIIDNSKGEARVRAWANIKQGELLYNKSQRSEYSGEQAGKKELLQQAISCYQQALKIGQKWPDVVGQASIELGLCYENLGQFELASEQYRSIISQEEELFAGTIWLGRAKDRKKFLAGSAEEKVIFVP